jgi:DNA repair photolyase
MIAPLMPGINDDPEQVEEIVRLAEEAGATFIGSVALHLRDEVRDVFMGWLRLKRPDLVPRYEELYADGRAYAPAEERKRLSGLVNRARRSSTPARTTRPARSRRGSRAARASR